MEKDPSFDRRKYPRLQTEQLVSIARMDAPVSLANALDLSVGGIRFQCVGLDVALGEALEVTFNVGDRTASVVGSLVRVTELDAFTQEVALAFTRVDPQILELLEDVREG